MPAMPTARDTQLGRQHPAVGGVLEQEREAEEEDHEPHARDGVAAGEPRDDGIGLRL
jgi:hypothetical protein